MEREDPSLKEDYDFWNNEFPDIARPPAAESSKQEEMPEEGKIISAS